MGLTLLLPQVCWGWVLEDACGLGCWLFLWLPLTEAGLVYSPFSEIFHTKPSVTHPLTKGTAWLQMSIIV